MNALVKMWSSMVANVRQQRVLDEREIFFDRICEKLTGKADHASIKFGQYQLLKNAKIVERLVDNESGVLYITYESNFNNKIGRHSYSLYLTGDLFRIGLLLYGDLQNAPLVDWHNEMQSLWPGSVPIQYDRQGSTMYEWTHMLPDLYTNFATQERYILGMRHMHGRVIRIISDYRLIEEQENPEDNPQDYADNHFN